MNIALINPPSSFLLDDRVFPYLGLLSVATQMQWNGDKVEMFDLSGRKDFLDATWDIADNGFDWFGITSTSANFPNAYRINQEIKAMNPYNKTMIGGPHATAMGQVRRINPNDPNIKALEEFDKIIEGDGENYPDAINSGTKWNKMKMIDVNTNFIPNRKFYDMDSYKFQMNGRKATTILTQRGCPFRCEFCCGRDIESYRTSRMRKPDGVLKEMEYLENQYGFRSFMWFDDEINISKPRIEELAKRLKKVGYTHRGFIRSDLADGRTLDLLAEAGFVELCTGVESGSDRILKILNKGLTSAQNKTIARMIKERGMRYKAFTMVGNPDETYDDVMMTRDWLLEVKPDSFDVAMLQPYPGSILYDQAMPDSTYPQYEWQHKGLFFTKPDYSKQVVFHKGTPGEYKCYSRTRHLTSDRLIELREQVEREAKCTK